MNSFEIKLSQNTKVVFFFSEHASTWTIPEICKHDPYFSYSSFFSLLGKRRKAPPSPHFSRNQGLDPSTKNTYQSRNATKIKPPQSENDVSSLQIVSAMRATHIPTLLLGFLQSVFPLNSSCVAHRREACVSNLIHVCIRAPEGGRENLTVPVSCSL